MSRRALGPAGLSVLRAVRTAVGTQPPTGLLVACSGGADSLALAAATLQVSSSMNIPAAVVVVDHRLQPGSAGQAERAANQLAELGYVDPLVRVAEPGPTDLGPEGAARVGRYAVLDAEAKRLAAVVLLGHTLDDQAETVLLGLARGSGLRSLAGMSVRSGNHLRPLLRLRRSCTVQACSEWGLRPWTDPQNADRSFTRVRVRHQVLPMLEAELGGRSGRRAEGEGDGQGDGQVESRIAEALARTAELARDDVDYLDHQAAELVRLACSEDRSEDSVEDSRAHPSPDAQDSRPPSLDCEVLALAPRALRTRAIRSWLLDHGAPEVSATRVWAVEALIVDWHGQRWIDVPALRVRRRDGRLFIERPRPVG